jgi:hypothetical protein
MKTVDTMQTQADCQSVPVLILLGSVYELCWNAQTAFAQQQSAASGPSSLALTSSAFALLASFKGWDIALQPNPFSNIGLSFTSLIEGVTP